MTAGESAGLEAERQLALAAAHEAEALAARERAENFMAASASEKRTVQALTASGRAAAPRKSTLWWSAHRACTSWIRRCGARSP